MPVDTLMENAGSAVYRFCDRPAAVVCGVGNNAGDGLVCARHLHEAGRLAGVCCVDPSRLKGPAARALELLERSGVQVAPEIDLNDAEVIVDALFGVGLNRAPEGRFAGWIEAINASVKQVVAVDVPSGLDADTGVAYAPCVRADLTVTFGLPKRGLLIGDGPRLSGEVWVADIGLPAQAFEALGIAVPDALFSAAKVVRL